MHQRSRWRQTLLIRSGLAFLVLLATGCGAADGEGDNRPTAEPFLIGIFQIVQHPVADAAREGFVAALPPGTLVAGRPVQYEVQNAHGDNALFDQIASRFVVEDVDLVYVLGTPVAQAIASRTKEIPIVLGGATDPVAAGLVQSWERPGTNVTGTSDIPRVDAHFDMLEELLPSARRVGVVYNAGEINSMVVVERTRRVAAARGLELVERVAATTAEVPQAAASLVGSADVIYVTTDNTVAAALPALMQVASDAQIPVFGCTGDTVREGAVFALAVDYEEIGRLSALMATEILEGRDPATMPIRFLENPTLFLNLDSARRLGINVPEVITTSADEVIDSHAVGH